MHKKIIFLVGWLLVKIVNDESWLGIFIELVGRKDEKLEVLSKNDQVSISSTAFWSLENLFTIRPWGFELKKCKGEFTTASDASIRIYRYSRAQLSTSLCKPEEAFKLTLTKLIVLIKYRTAEPNTNATKIFQYCFFCCSSKSWDAHSWIQRSLNQWGKKMCAWEKSIVPPNNRDACNNH